MSASLVSTLDLRQVAPLARSSLLFSRFSALQPGQTLELINAQDPQPLNEQLQLRAPGLFSWRELEQGPLLWRAEVGKSAAAKSATAGSCCSGGACCG